MNIFSSSVLYIYIYKVPVPTLFIYISVLEADQPVFCFYLLKKYQEKLLQMLNIKYLQSFHNKPIY